MTQSTVTRLPIASTSRTGSASRSSSANGAEFAASMTAVVTINVSDDGQKSKTAPQTSINQTDTGGASTGESTSETEIEIEITTLEGDDLAKNLNVTSKRGSAEISIASNGDIGVSTDGLFYSDNPEVQIGETLTFTVPKELGNVQGATINVSNLVNDKNGAESALVIAYDGEGKEVLRCLVKGNESGNVTVDIDVSFAKVDFKPVDNGSWTLIGNSDFTIDRIDIKTRDVSEPNDPGHRSGNGLDGFHGFFEQRNFILQREVQRQQFQSFKESFKTRPATDDRQVDDTIRKDLDDQGEAVRRIVQG